MGELPQGGGLLVWLVEDVGAEVAEVECVDGRLAVEIDRELTHLYDGSWAYPTLYHGPYGQAALVEYCEGQMVGMSFAEGALLPPGEAPEWLGATLPVEVAHLDAVGWLGLTGFFAGDATFYDGENTWSDTVVIDPFDRSTSLLTGTLGRRAEDPVNGIDVLVPDGWNFAPVDVDTAATLLSEPGSGSWVTITVLTETPPAPVAASDETLVDTSVVDVAVWQTRGAGRAVEQRWLTGVDYRFGGPLGYRSVRFVTMEDRTVTIESYVDVDAGRVQSELPAIVVDSVRIYDTVG